MHHQVTHSFQFTDVLQVLEPTILVLLLVLSTIMYAWAVIALIFQRALPEEVAPPRITLVALGVCATPKQ